jgi:hypothetical protein
MLDKIIYFFGCLGILLTTVIIVGCLWFMNRAWFHVTWQQCKTMVLNVIDRTGDQIIDSVMGYLERGKE